MSWREVRRDLQRADLHDLAIVECAIDRHGWIAWPAAATRVRWPERTLRVDAALQVRHFREAGHHRRAGAPLQLDGSAGLIDVAVIQEDRLDVGHLEAERFDVLLSAIDRRLEARAHQDVPLRRCQEVALAVCRAEDRKSVV